MLGCSCTFFVFAFKFCFTLKIFKLIYLCPLFINQYMSKQKFQKICWKWLMYKRKFCLLLSRTSPELVTTQKSKWIYNNYILIKQRQVSFLKFRIFYRKYGKWGGLHKFTAIQRHLTSLHISFILLEKASVFTLETYFVFCYHRVQNEEILFL